MRAFVVLLFEWFRFHPSLDDDCFLCACCIAEISMGDPELRFCTYSDEVASFGGGLSARFISEGYQRLMEQEDTSRRSSLLLKFYCEFENLLAAVRRRPWNSTATSMGSQGVSVSTETQTLLAVLQDPSKFPSHYAPYQAQLIEGEQRSRLNEAFPLLQRATRILVAQGSLALRIEGLPSIDADEVIELFELAENSDLASFIENLLSGEEKSRESNLKTFTVVRWRDSRPLPFTKSYRRLTTFGPIRSQQEIVGFSNAVLAILSFFRESTKTTFKYYYKLFRPSDVCTLLQPGERPQKQSSVKFTPTALLKLRNACVIEQRGTEVRLVSRYPYIFFETSDRVVERLCIRMILEAFDASQRDRPKVKSYLV